MSWTTSAHFRPVFATRVGFVVTPSRTPHEAASRISSMFAVSRKILTIAVAGLRKTERVMNLPRPRIVPGRGWPTGDPLGETLGLREGPTIPILGPSGWKDRKRNRKRIGGGSKGRGAPEGPVGRQPRTYFSFGCFPTNFVLARIPSIPRNRLGLTKKNMRKIIP